MTTMFFSKKCLTCDLEYGYNGLTDYMKAVCRPDRIADFLVPFWRDDTSKYNNGLIREYDGTFTPLCSQLSPAACSYLKRITDKTKGVLMQTALTIFNYQSNQIRTEIINDEPYFCGIDVCNALSIKNNRNVIGRLTDGVHTVDIIDKLGRKQCVSYINEPNLYKVAFQSRKPAAESFVNWVCKKVLPSIRKTGGYGIPAIDMKAMGGMVKRCTGAAIREAFSADSATSLSALDFIINQIAEERAMKKMRVWKDTIKSHILDELA